MEQSKFTGVLAKLKHSPADEPVSSIETPVLRGKGRPPGKRSNPDFQPTTILLRKETKKAAMRLLEDQEAGLDLSELIEELLTEWIQRQS